MEAEQCSIFDKKFRDDGQRREVMTKVLCSRLNEYAKTLNNGKIVARLSAGDVIAQELEYHKDCLTTLYNSEKCHLDALRKQKKMKILRERESTHLYILSSLLI